MKSGCPLEGKLRKIAFFDWYPSFYTLFFDGNAFTLVRTSTNLEGAGKLIVN